MDTFSDKLRELREERDLKQKEVADALFISNKMLSSYERGISQPPIDMLKCICEYYQVSADMLLGIGEPDGAARAFSDGAGSLPSGAGSLPAGAGVTDADDRRLLSYYHRLDGESKEAIRGLMICYCKELERRRAAKGEVDAEEQD
jgi:transcriptional regulator with XRE-family HTH domain